MSQRQNPENVHCRGKGRPNWLPLRQGHRNRQRTPFQDDRQCLYVFGNEKECLGHKKKHKEDAISAVRILWGMRHLGQNVSSRNMGGFAP